MAIDGCIGYYDDVVRQRFYQVRNATSDYMSGMGIGLYVVHEIVTLHGGKVFVISNEGQGSSFIVTLPLMSLNDQAGPAE